MTKFRWERKQKHNELEGGKSISRNLNNDNHDNKIHIHAYEIVRKKSQQNNNRQINKGSRPLFSSSPKRSQISADKLLVNYKSRFRLHCLSIGNVKRASRNSECRRYLSSAFGQCEGKNGISAIESIFKYFYSGSFHLLFTNSFSRYHSIACPIRFYVIFLEQTTTKHSSNSSTPQTVYSEPAYSVSMFDDALEKSFKMEKLNWK